MVEITQIAAEKLKEIMAEQDKGDALLRLYIAGFGCSGPNFGMALDESQKPDDTVIEAFGVTIVVDQQSAPHLEGAVINYVDSEYGSGFEIKSPHQSDCSSGCGSCGCGS